jgi:hypothetical protein
MKKPMLATATAFASQVLQRCQIVQIAQAALDRQNVTSAHAARMNRPSNGIGQRVQIQGSFLGYMDTFWF